MNPDRTINSEIIDVWFFGREPLDKDDHTAFFTGKCLKGSLLYYSNYPAEPPVFLFDKLKNGKTFVQMNIYVDGTVCQHTLNEQHWKTHHANLVTILKSIQSILYYPNERDPANADLADDFINNEESYWNIQRSQVQYFYS